MDGQDLVGEVTCAAPYDWNEGHWALDGGYAQPRRAAVAAGRRLRLRHQAQHPAQPGQHRLPRARRSRQHAGERRLAHEAGRRLPLQRSRRSRRVPYAAEAVRELIGKKPIFGICLGHQILGLALGGTTYKLKFGHHGGNQPVMDLTTGKVEITSAEPRLRRRRRLARRTRRADPRQSQRPDRRRPVAHGAAAVLRAVPSRSRRPGRTTPTICSSASSTMMDASR